MKSILKKVAVVALAAVLALGMIGCSNGSIDDPVMPPVSGKQTVATPAFSVESGAVNSGTEVTITCATEDAKIYYTKDGSNPTVSSSEYTTAISVTEAVTLKTIAVKDGMNDSAVASVSYTIKGTVATPAFCVASGAVDSGTEGAKIYYTKDGSEPTAASTEYKAAISVTPPMTLKAIAVKDGMNDSAVASASYSIIPTPGVFVLKDGTMLPKDITLTDTQKSNIAAVIVRAAADGKPALGVGIVHNKMAWCTESAAGCSTIITALKGDRRSDYMDGSNSWDLLVAACEDLKNATAETIETVAQNYPAWNYCRNYGANNGLEGDLATGWYLPTVAELDTIYQNKTAVDASLFKAGGRTFGKSYYWSCCQDYSSKNDALGLGFYNNVMCFTRKFNDINYVCSVRAF